MARVGANEVLVIGYKVSFFHHSMYQCYLGAFQNHDGLLLPPKAWISTNRMMHISHDDRVPPSTTVQSHRGSLEAC
jgi:hypothetical protein